MKFTLFKKPLKVLIVAMGNVFRTDSAQEEQKAGMQQLQHQMQQMQQQMQQHMQQQMQQMQQNLQQQFQQQLQQNHAQMAELQQQLVDTRMELQHQLRQERATILGNVTAMMQQQATSQQDSGQQEEQQNLLSVQINSTSTVVCTATNDRSLALQQETEQALMRPSTASTTQIEDEETHFQYDNDE